ncbi:MAG: rod shape-determining protein RodA [Bacteroidales bacterium]|jgi:rod shape determining protein RodA|nr:rod shape-determining protein RodA [Bacteroidales bacterium]
MRRPTNIITGLDWATIGIYTVLVLMGWFNIYAAVYDEQNASIFALSQRYGKQLIWIITAVVLAVTVCLLDTRFYTSFAYPIYFISILSLIAVLIVGKEVNASKSWFYIAGIQIQPSEFAKIATSLALAKYLGNFSGKMMQFRTLVILGAIIFLPPAFIILQPDPGSCLVYIAFLFVLYREGLHPSILLFGILAVVLFILSLLMQDMQAYLVEGLILAGFIAYLVQSRQFKLCFKGIGIFLIVFGVLTAMNLFINSKFELHEVLLGTSLIASALLVIFSFIWQLPFIRITALFIVCALLFTFSVDFVFDEVLDTHHQKRILVMLGKESDPKGIEYNVIQSKIAIGSGGFAGKGFLQGTQTKYNFVPEQSTDFIFCTVGEEHGFVGVFIVLALFIALLLRLIYIAERQRSVFSRVYGYCTVSILFFHITVNIGMTVGLLPVIGIPLPFFSYGGSSLWAFTILLFIMLRLDASRYEYIR